MYGESIYNMINIHRNYFQAHPFHLVSPSPWPLYTSISLLCLTTSAVLSFHTFSNAEYILTLSFISLVLSMTFWFRDIIAEGTYIGNHTLAVQRGLNMGVALFIVSEALFFVAIFWTFFHSALSPTVELGAMWPPMGIEAIDPFELPLANTVILLASGFTVTYSHHYLINGNRKRSLDGLVYTVILAIIFTGLQGVEYSVSTFTISDGAFGSCFYFGTGLIQRAPFKYNTKNTNNLTIFKSKLSSYSSILQGYWVTGFSDAESTFSIIIVKDKSMFLGIRLIFVFSIKLDIRDIKILKKIQKFFNVGSLTVRIRKGKHIGIYSVQSLKDLTQVIIPHFNKYPLLTQKAADFLLFKQAIKIFNNKAHLTVDSLNQLVGIKASMHKGLSYILKLEFSNYTPVERPIIKNPIIKSPLWLVGFIEGRGCFYSKITKNRQVNLIFSMSQHFRDSNLFNVIKNYLACGIIEKAYIRPNTVNLIIYKLEDIKKIISFFEVNPLITQKHLNFNSFKFIAYLMSNKFNRRRF